MMNLCFPAVRIVHELFGDRLSPKTRFYPGLYTFFSVWGVVLGMITIVLFLWEFAVCDNKEVRVENSRRSAKELRGPWALRVLGRGRCPA